MEFKDRVANKPNRMKLTFEDTSAVEYVLVELADEPVEEGTPLNRDTFMQLQDELTDWLTDAEYQSCFYRIINDEKEWLNPPVVYNDISEYPIEYRTTERWNGKPVYTFAQKMTLEADTSLTTGALALKDDSISSVVRFDAKTSRYQLPYDLRNNSRFIDFRIRTDATSFTVERGSSTATERETLYIQLWYTKK